MNKAKRCLSCDDLYDQEDLFNGLCELCMVCDRCGGEGFLEVINPSYGSRTCSEPDIPVECPQCGGSGEYYNV